jgi:hypothetical protein
MGHEAFPIVPIPMAPTPTIPREEARRSLGLSHDSTVLLAMGMAYKFNAINGYSLYEPIDRALERPRTEVVFIGPETNHPLVAALAARHAGRVRALGVVPSPRDWLCAADVYIESFPFSSSTAMFEATTCGARAVCYQPVNGDMDVLYSELTDVPETLYVAHSPDEFAALCTLDEETEAAAAELTLSLRGGLQRHSGEGWRSELRRALASPIPDSHHPSPPARSRDLLDTFLVGLGGDARYEHYASAEDSLAAIRKLQIRAKQFRGRVLFASS